ncbi:MAG: hypothetical protein EU533_03700 [Promethearchaeota archaeon]|nr:MAG: hypothetical protein EU533_03700 [Candidatus Lokiarchaeota archaeon]
MWISTVIILLVFVTIIVLLMLEKVNRIVLVLCGAIICFFTLTFIEGKDYSIFIGFIFGTPSDNFVNSHSLFLIFGISIIIQICHISGLFSFLSLKLILATANRPKLLLFILCTVTVIISAIINNILTVMIIIPLTITVSRILNIDPEPFIITQAVLVNIGGTFFSLSSIPNILITGSSGIGFNDFFLNVGILSIVVFLLTVGLFYLIYGKSIQIPRENIGILKELSPSSMIPNKSLLIKSSIVLVTVFVLFIIIPPIIVPPDIIAIGGAMVLVLISSQDMEKIINEIDTGLLFYLMGIFVIAGSLEDTGLLQQLGEFIARLSGDNILVAILSILWISGLLSATIDNIPITKVLIPAVSSITVGYTEMNRKLAFYSLAIGANWGDNFTPMGDNILVMNIASKNKRPIRMREFWRIGFIATFFQLCIVTIFYGFLLNWVFGIFALLGFMLIFGLYYVLKLNTQTILKFKNYREKKRSKRKNGNEKPKKNKK